MLIMGVCYTYSLFQPYVMEHFGVDSASASLPYTIFIAVFCLGNFIGGQMQKKTNLRLTLIVGYVLMFAGWMVTAFLPQNMFWMMYLTFGGLFLVAVTVLSILTGIPMAGFSAAVWCIM